MCDYCRHVSWWRSYAPCRSLEVVYGPMHTLKALKSSLVSFSSSQSVVVTSSSTTTLRPRSLYDENLFSDFEGASCVMRTQYFCSTDANGPYGISSGLVRHRHDVCWSTAPIIALPGTYGRPTKYTGSATTAPHSGHVCLSLMFHATGRTGEHRCRSLLRAARKYGPSPLEIVTRIALVRCTRTE